MPLDGPRGLLAPTGAQWGARCPYAFTWPSLLVHFQIMHAPCQLGATAPQARNLWWCKARRTAGDGR